MDIARARWAIQWHNLDAPLKTGERRVFAFAAEDEPVPAGCDLVFDVDGEPDARLLRATVAAVAHPVLGAVSEVDTSVPGSYTFRFADGRWARIDTEQAHGVVEACGGGFAAGGPGWTRFQDSWDRYPDWDLDVDLADVEAA